MKKVLIGVSIALLASVGAISIVAARYEERIRPNTFVGLVDVGDLSRSDAQRKIRIWWESERTRELQVSVEKGRLAPVSATPGKLGITIDDEATIESLPTDSFWESTAQIVGGKPEKRVFEPRFKSNGESTEWITDYVRRSIGNARPAAVRFVAGVIHREHEISGYEVDLDELPSRVVEAIRGDGSIMLPLTEAPKRIPDAELDKITDVVAEFSTRFPAGEHNRNANLALASGKLDGMILMPGEVFSFNQSVGKRTMDEGYRLAPVLANGRHDTGIGGGICQVSTTLYNAVALSNLEIVQRNNHSMASTYVSIGRDATVSWPNLDLKFRNNTDGPIAISRTYVPGKLTFRILGKKVPGQEVKLEAVGHQSWARGLVYEHDPSLPFGKQKVVEKGSRGHKVTVYRLIYQNGQLVKRELFNRSNYAGANRIIAVNKKAKPPVASVTPGVEPEGGGEPLGDPEPPR